jgi:hypothetical protein
VSVGLLCVLAWYGAIGYEIKQYGDNLRTIAWSPAEIGAAICFVGGWGLIHFAARQPASPNQEAD